jgi:hypothetical protein
LLVENRRVCVEDCQLKCFVCFGVCMERREVDDKKKSTRTAVLYMLKNKTRFMYINATNTLWTI